MISSVLITSVLLGGHEHDHSVNMVMFHFSTLSQGQDGQGSLRASPNSGRNFGLFLNRLCYATLDASNEITQLACQLHLDRRETFHGFGISLEGTPSKDTVFYSLWEWRPLRYTNSSCLLTMCSCSSVTQWSLTH